MNSLRTRIALTLLSAIVCVVAMSTVAIYFATRGFEERHLGERVVDQIKLLAPLISSNGDGAKPHLAAAPAAGDPNERLSSLLKKLLRDAGFNFDVAVTQSAARDPVVSVNFGPGWLAIPIHHPHRRPFEVWMALAGWMSLIAIGTAGVSLMISHRITRQLAFLESMAKQIGSDGFLPRLPESGPAEVRATARALNTMGASLKAAVESRMRLVAAAGHDLRTPLTRMRLRAEFYEDEDRSQWLHDLDELDRIADSAIQLVREETNEKPTERVRVDEVVTAICHELVSMNYAVAAGQIEQATISSSPLALTRALRNLIINAATHGGSALVSVTASNRQATIVIDDDGPGIPEETMSRVFEPFFRVDMARRKSVPGAGLGLAIAKEIVERHGGNLKLCNRQPHGLRQEVTFAVAGQLLDWSCRTPQFASCARDAGAHRRLSTDVTGS